MDDRHYVSVLLPVAVDRPYTYASDRPLQPGSIVAVPLGPREVIGCVWTDAPDDVAPEKIRDIARIFDFPALAPSLVGLVDWIADYTFSPRGMVLRMVLRSPAALEPEKPLIGVRLTDNRPDRMTAAREKVIAAADGGLAWSKSGLAQAAGVSAGVIDGLVKQSVLEDECQENLEYRIRDEHDYTASVILKDAKVEGHNLVGHAKIKYENAHPHYANYTCHFNSRGHVNDSSYNLY